MEQSDIGILREICALNGIEFYGFGEVFNIKKLHIFFNGFPKFINFEQFPYLCELVIISQDVAEISYLDSCPNLKKLWICESQLKYIRNIESCSCLQELYLYGNEIEKIENLSGLTHLRTLNLADNYIRVIEGISKLNQLSILDLSGNRITRISLCLLENENLQALSLSGNDLRHISDITNLCAIPKLVHLNLNSGGYPKNPICINPNLTVIILYYLPKLKLLDDCDISPCDLQHAIQSIVMAKRSYYTMKHQYFHSQCHAKIKKTERELQKTHQDYIKHVGSLHKNFKLLENSKARKNYGKHEQDQLSSWINKIQSRLKTWIEIFDHSNNEQRICVERQQRHLLLKKALYQIELEMWGDFNFTEISRTELVFQKLSDLLCSRLCIHDSNTSNIISLKISHVYKVFNRVVELGFCDTMKGADDSISRCSSFSDGQSTDCVEVTSELKYLILPVNHTKDMLSLMNILKLGFGDGSNSNHLYTYLNDSDRTQLESIGTIKTSNNRIAFSSLLLLKSLYSEEESLDVLKAGNCNFIAIPEYVVEIEYISKNVKTFNLVECITETSKQNQVFSFKEEKLKDETFLKSIPEKYLRNITRELNENSLEVYCEQKLHNMSNAMHVSLLDIRFTATISLQCFKSLTHLYINHCSLSCPPNISTLPLTVVDLSYNRLVTVNTLKELQKVIVLDLSFNSLCDLHEVTMVTKVACSNLCELFLRGNPWKYRDNLHHFVAKNISTLILVDGFETKDMDLRDEISLETTSTDLLLTKENSFWTDLDIFSTKCTTIFSTGEYLSHWQKLLKPSGVIPWNNISTICLKGCNLRKLENMERLINLQYVCLDENYLTTLNGIFDCVNVEEISAENNFISSFDDFAKLSKLRRLLLANNSIKHLGYSVKDNSTLKVLSVHSNKIQSISGVEKYFHLNELYVGNNNIAAFESVLLLKGLDTLSVLDLSENSITLTCQNYRLRVIFHLKSIKALDGELVTNSDHTFAREQLGGHLSVDFLMDHLEQSDFRQLTYLDLANCGLKYVDFIDPESIPCLISINLEKNLLTSFGGLVFLTQVEVLCLNENSITCLFSKTIGTQESMNTNVYERSAALYRSKCPLFPKLKVLHLSRNQLSSLQPLLLHRMPSLRCLFLQHNEISSFREFEELKQLKELVLDCNKLKGLHDVPKLYSLNELHLENNRLREISPLSSFRNLRRLYVSGNKLNDPADLETFSCTQKQLVEISMIDNPIQYKRLHRLILAHNMPGLQIIDGVQVTTEERDHANAFYSEQDLQLYFNSNATSQHNQVSLHNTKTCPVFSEFSLTGVKPQKTLLPATKVNIAVSQYIVGRPKSREDEDRTGRYVIQSATTGGRRREKQAISPLSTFAFQTKPLEFIEENKDRGYGYRKMDECLPGMTIQPALSPQLQSSQNVLGTRKDCTFRKQNRS